MKRIIDWLYNNSILIWLVITWIFIIFVAFIMPFPTKTNNVLKDYKDGIQNHLAWDIKGQCFFVRPNDDVTVYMIRVTDCDKK